MSKPRSFESFAAVIDCNRDTLYEWVKVHEEFSDALTRGRAKHLEKMEELGMSMLVENFQGPKLNTALYKLFMANIHGWREKTEVSGSDEKPLEIRMKYDRKKADGS